MNESAEKVPWAKSKAKAILTSEILVGNVTKDSNWKDVYYSFPEFQLYDKQSFCSNLKNLIKALTIKEERALFDQNAVQHDRNRHPRKEVTKRGVPFWDTSEASKLLKEDIDNEIPDAIGIDDLWNSRDEYKLFPKDVFRQHLYQEKYSRLGKTYWMKRKKNNEKT
jgi:hypothetical protein